MTIASAQTMAVPDGVRLMQSEDFARNAIKLTVVYQDREHFEYVAHETLRRMDRSAFQQIIDSMVARVMTAPRFEGDLPGGLENWPVSIMAEGDHVAFTHPDWPDESFLVRFTYSRGPWQEVRLEWPGHGNVQMPAVRANGTYVREVIAEAMAMVSVLMV